LKKNIDFVAWYRSNVTGAWLKLNFSSIFWKSVYGKSVSGKMLAKNTKRVWVEP